MAAIAEQVVGAVRAFVAAAVAPLAARLQALEQRQPERGERGPEGPAGAPGERGPQGLAGAPGERGPQGLAAAPGTDGRDGRDGKDGRDGAPGLAGAPGERGLDGRDGAPGAPGRDALEMDIAPAIDAARSYPRGTWAQHAGGIVRAIRNTDPLEASQGDLTAAGWAVQVRGVAGIALMQTDERTYALSLTYSDGSTQRHDLSVPALIDRGVWQELAYAPGDAVTWDGSLWIRQAGHADERPGTGKAWRLAVKRGRDGKDGRDGLKGDKGDRGAEGRPGRDLTQMGPDGGRY